MNSFQLPKITNKINLILSNDDTFTFPFISFSYYKSLVLKLDIINNLTQNIDISLDVMNPFSQVYNSKSKAIVSKLSIYNATMYGFIEVIESFRFSIENTNFFYQGNNFVDFSLVNLHFREKEKEREKQKGRENMKLNVVLCDIAKSKFSNHVSYVEACCEILETVIHYGSPNTTFIIALDHLFLKPVVELLFVLTSLFAKVTITKPAISNVSNFEKFVVCQGFTPLQDFRHLREALKNARETKCVKPTFSFLSREIPVFFKNKIDEINVVLGQQQLDSICSFVSLLSNKNRDDKIENITRSNLSKCVYWCEKNKVPFFRQGEKVNIFKNGI